jgi:nicotinamide mononucleotide transporter
MTPLEIAAALVTLANVWLATYENMWTWPTGIGSVVLYAIFFFQQRLYGNAFLQLIFFIMTLHGWYEWLRGGVNHSRLRVRRASRRQWIGTMTAALLLTPVIVWILRRFSGSAPILDGLTTAFSISAQWMLNEKLLENWWVWFVVDIVTVRMLMFSHSYITAGLYSLLGLLCVKGIIDWRRSIASA